MHIFILFILGCVVTAITATAVVLVGLGEAADPSQSREEDLNSWERERVREERSRRMKESAKQSAESS